MSVWSKRRAAVAAEERAEIEARQAALRQAEEQALAERPDAELLAEAGLKEPEALLSAEEVRAFLKHALPERLKRRALRRLWGLNPVLANVDGLVDYGEDFTDKAVCIENMQTLYTVGKGMLEQFKTLNEADEATEVALKDEADEVEGLASRTSLSEESDEVDDEAPDQVRGASDGLADVGDEVPDQVGDGVAQADLQVQPRDGGASAEYLSDLDDPEPLAPHQRRMRFTFERV